MNNLSKYATAGEARAARKLVKAALAAGYCVSVSDGEEWTVKKSTNASEIIDALCTTGEDILRLRDPADGAAIGSFLLVYGNDDDGSELLADYTDNNVCNALYQTVYNVTAAI